MTDECLVAENRLLIALINELIDSHNGHWFSRYHTEMRLDHLITPQIAEILRRGE